MERRHGIGKFGEIPERGRTGEFDGIRFVVHPPSMETLGVLFE